MHSGDEPVGLCDTGLRAVVYCLIVFNVRVCLIVFFVQLRLCNQRLLRSFRLCSIRNGGGVRFRPVRRSSASPSRAHTPQGTRMFAKVRRTNLLLILVLMHPTLSLNILRSRYHLALVQRSHLLLLLRLLLSLRIHCSRGHGFLHRFLLCFLMYKGT